MKKNECITLTVTSNDRNGNGIAHTPDGMTVFVKNTCEGDIVRAKIIKVLKSYAVAIPECILQPSADRSADGCVVSGKCGGCAFRHMTYEAECRYKEKSINDAFGRIGKLELTLSAFHPAKNVDNYRNKAIYPVGVDKNGDPISGFYANVSHRIVEHETCAIAPDIFARIRDAVLEFVRVHGISVYDEERFSGTLRNIYMRSAASGEVVLTLVIAESYFGSEAHEKAFTKHITALFPQITSILINVNTKKHNAVVGDKWRTLWGDGYLHDTLCGKAFRVSPASFWQVNHDMAEVLYGIAAKFAALKPGEKLLDLYCGTGSVGICVANGDTKLLGVEIVEQAAKDAAFNAKQNRLTEAEFICLDAAHALDDEKLLAFAPDVITVDPPRKGCGEEAVKKIAALGAKRIVYISCDPATLARDLAVFEANGYHAERAEGCDLFARTGHVETVCLLSKLRADQHIEVELNLDEMDLTTAESKATYDEIKEYVLENTGLKVSQLYIAQVKRKYGIIERANYNLPKSENAKVPNCPPDKEAAIVEALKHFGMVK